MRLSLKFLATLWLILLIILGAFIYNAYSKLKPEAFTQILKEEIQRSYPGAELVIEKISYNISLDFKFGLKNVLLRRNKQLLARIGILELRIPWWLFIVNEGSAQINVQDLDIFIDQDIDHGASVTLTDKKVSSLDISLPAYLAEARYTLRANNLSIRDIRSGRRYFALSKLLVREFQYGKNSAFELNIPVSIKRKNRKYRSELWLFGDLTPRRREWSLNYRGELRTKDNSEILQFEDLVINGKALFHSLPLRLSSELELSIEKTPVAKGTLNVNQEFMEFFLEVTQLPFDYVGLVYEDIRTPYLLNPKGLVKGNLKLNKRINASSHHISSKIVFDGDFHFSDKDTISGSWQMGLNDNRVDISFMSPKGETSFFRRSLIDSKNLTVTQYTEELGFTGLDLRIISNSIPSIDKVVKDQNSPFYTSTISFKRCLFGESIFNGQFRFGHTPEQSFYQGELHDEKSSLTLKSLETISKNSLEIGFKKFKWGSFFLFLEPYFSAESGELDGSVQGEWNKDWREGKWLIKIEARDLVESRGFYTEMIGKITSLFGLDSKSHMSHQFNLSLKDNVFNLNTLLLENNQSRKIVGTLGTKQKSFLTLSYPQKAKAKVIRKEVTRPFWMMEL